MPRGWRSGRSAASLGSARVQRSKTFDGCERYRMCPAASKRREAGNSGGLVRTLTHPDGASVGLGRRLLNKLEPAQDRLEGLVQRGIGGALGLGERAGDDLGGSGWLP